MSDKKDFKKLLESAQAKLEKRREIENLEAAKIPEVVENKQSKKNYEPLPPPPESMPKSRQHAFPGFEHLVPKTPKGTAPIGNHIARTNLFSPTRRGRRKYLYNVQLHGPAGADISFTGVELDMGDQDVLLHALRLAAGENPETEIKVGRYAFLKSIGRSTGNKDYKWLEESFFRISKGHVDMKTKDFSVSYPLFGPLLYDKKEGNFYFTIPRKTLELFHGGFAYINMERRLMLESQIDLAKWLQSYASTHKKGEHKVKSETLYRYLGYEMRMRDFKRALENAMSELVRVEEFTEWSWVEEDRITVRWVRK